MSHIWSRLHITQINSSIISNNKVIYWLKKTARVSWFPHAPPYSMVYILQPFCQIHLNGIHPTTILPNSPQWYTSYNHSAKFTSMVYILQPFCQIHLNGIHPTTILPNSHNMFLSIVSYHWFQLCQVFIS